MKKLLSVVIVLLIGHAVLAQDSTKTEKPVPAAKPAPVKKNKITYESLNLANRPNDHFMMILGYDNWIGKPDTIRTTGLSRSFAFYFMMDFPFKTDPHFSVGAGLGFSWSNVFFDKQQVLVEANNATLAFPDKTNTDHFKKYKLVNTYVELPIELRYALNPENTNRSWKFALGVKPGLMLDAYTKGKNMLNQAGQLEQAYIEKESSKKFFNGSRVAATARVSYGFLGVFGQINITPLIKSGAGPIINPYTIGIVLSGL
ncbi:MAG TPA: outer membrane beta-barrel protein [Puia sp.]|nr:outer membrane beta-barrel protein [Puia sp.]